MKKQDKQLDQVLQEWRVTAPLPPRFQEQVWKRIERSEAPGATLRGVLSGWLTGMLARPAVAVGYVSAFLVLGLVLGFVEAGQRAARWDRQLEARYVQSINPYQRSPL